MNFVLFIKNQLARLIAKACRGEEAFVSRDDRTPGILKGKLRVGPEFFEPLPPEELIGFE